MDARLLTIIALGYIAIAIELSFTPGVTLEKQRLVGKAEDPEISFKEDETEMQVLFDGEIFTSLHFDDVQKPYLYPVISAGGAHVTRAYPIEEKSGEAKDHPHHTSLWFAHGDVSGHDFWHGGHGERIVHIESNVIKAEKAGGEHAASSTHSWPGIRSLFAWRTGKGEVVCTEQRVMRFSGNNTTRVIDFDLTLTASKQAITFGDTKEGTFGIRLAPTLRLTGTVAKGSARNSEGVTGGEVWGKRARWIEYSGPVDDKQVSVAILDHADNPRHPTWWHAREYGLVAANAFGRRAFEGKSSESGDLSLQPGQSIRFKYRVVIQDGTLTAKQLDQTFKDWSKQSPVESDGRN